jgi:hypothetical protein
MAESNGSFERDRCAGCGKRTAKSTFGLQWRQPVRHHATPMICYRGRELKPDLVIATSLRDDPVWGRTRTMTHGLRPNPVPAKAQVVELHNYARWMSLAPPKGRTRTPNPANHPTSARLGN